MKVYGVRVPNGPTRYIGQTTGSVSKRLHRHKSYARAGGVLPLHRWLRRHPDAEAFVIIDDAVWNEDEIRVIKQHRDDGTKLLNCTAGGDGIKDPTPETRAKIRASKLGRKHTAEQRERQSMAQLGKKRQPCSAETRAKISASRTGQLRGPQSVEHRLRLGASKAGKTRKATVL